VAVPESVESRKPAKVQGKLNGDPHQEKLMPESTEEKKPSLELKTEGKGTTVPAASGTLTTPSEPFPEPVEAKALPPTETAKTQAPVVPESRKKKPKDVLKPAKEKVIEMPEPNVSAMVQAQTPTISEDLVPTDSSIHASSVSPLPAFPDIPLPKTHKIPFIKRSQVLAFLKKYTAAYERGNAETFFSYFTADAMENGKPLKARKPDYMEIWDKVQSLDYRIFVDGTEQVVGSDTVSMKGRFDLDWKFFDGGSGQSHGEIFMDLKLNKGALRISRLTYRFDGE